MYAGGPKHPIFNGYTFGLMSGEKPIFKPQIEGGHEVLGDVLRSMGLRHDETHGKYKEPERSYIVYNPSVKQMQMLGKMFGQESIVHSQNGQHKLVYTNGPNEGKYNAHDPSNPLEHFETPPSDYYTAIPYHGYARINFNFDQLHDLEPIKHPKQAAPGPLMPAATKSEREYEPAEAAYLAKGAIDQLLAAKTKQPHPHAYEWHDGHTDHHQEDLGQAQLPGLAKAGEHPHLDGGPPANDQSAPAGVATYRQYALPYGHIQPGQQTNLLHYPYQGKLPHIEKLVQDHGYKTYYGGGKYGKPDLANKNYNTGHLMVYDPTPGTGGDFGAEEYTRGWRQIHELAHALTYPELNSIYGEGRRIGKLGHHRTLNEAQRAVHWEWLAAHKQRELSKQIGVNLKDEDFHRELNTVMHDAVHRAVTGKFTEPSGEGFSPHPHKVPLNTALQMVRDAGHKLGLSGMHETLKDKPEAVPTMKSELKKGKIPDPNDVRSLAEAPHYQEDWGDQLEPGPAGQAPGECEWCGKVSPHLATHTHGDNALEGQEDRICPDCAKERTIAFGGERGRPRYERAQASAEKGLAALRERAKNKGIGRAAPHPRSWLRAAKSEAPTIFTAEGRIPVAEKLYTPEEANAILMKATREKIARFESEIKVLRERELRKSIIPSHNHNQASQASAGVEDVPAAAQKRESSMDKLTAKYGAKVAKVAYDSAKKKLIEKGSLHGGNGAGGPGGSVIAGPTAGPMKMSELCKTCGKKGCKCAGSYKKTELVDNQGKHSNSTHVTDTDKKSRVITYDPEVGVILPGKKPKKAGPITKQRVNDVKNDKGRESDLVVKKSEDEDKYHYYLVHNKTGKIHGGYEYESDAHDAAKDSPSPHEIKITHRSRVPASAKESYHQTNGISHKLHKGSDLNALPPPNAPKITSRPRAVGGQPAMGGPKLPGAHLGKAATPPMAKPPSGKNMGTSVPTSAPKAPPMVKAVPGTMGGDALQAAHAAPRPGAPAASKTPMPSSGAHQQRAAGHQAALGGAFQPKGPVSSGLDLARPAKPAGGVLGLKPLPMGAKPAAPTARPGIFGKMK